MAVWCPTVGFERTAPPAMVKSIYPFKTDQIALEDESEPDANWRA
jgi:hypothetical protein